MSIRPVYLMLSTLLLLHACGGGSGGGSSGGGDREEAIDKASRENIDNTLLPAVNDFSSQINTMTQSIGGFCATIDEKGLDDLKQHWRNLYESWYRLAPYNFGPMNDDLIFPTIDFIDSLRTNGTDYTATVRTSLNNQINGTQNLDKTFYDNLTFTRVGLLAIELLVFETAASQSTVNSDILIEYRTVNRKCDILKGMIEQLDKHADHIKDGWLVNFDGSGTPYRSLFINKQLPDNTEPMAALLVSVQMYLDYLHKRNVATQAAQLSDHAWQSMGAGIDQIEQILQGTAATTISFYSLIKSAGLQSYVDLVNANIATTRDAITARDPVAMTDALKALDGNFKREIPSGLNVDPGINFTDGD